MGIFYGENEQITQEGSQISCEVRKFLLPIYEKYFNTNEIRQLTHT